MKKSSHKNKEETHTVLFGIVSNEKFYRIAYFINKLADTDLKRQSELLKINIYNQEIELPYYYYKNTDYELFFLENSISGNKLIKKFKNIHYWFLLNKDPLAQETPPFDTILNTAPQIIAIFPIQDDKDKELISSLFFN